MTDCRTLVGLFVVGVWGLVVVREGGCGVYAFSRRELSRVSRWFSCWVISARVMVSSSVNSCEVKPRENENWFVFWCRD